MPVEETSTTTGQELSLDNVLAKLKTIIETEVKAKQQSNVGTSASLVRFWERHRLRGDCHPRLSGRAKLDGFCRRPIAELFSAGQARAPVPTRSVVASARAGRSRLHGAVPYNYNRQNVSREQSASWSSKRRERSC